MIKLTLEGPRGKHVLKLALRRIPGLACQHCQRQNTLLLCWEGAWSCWRPRCVRQVTGKK